MAAPVTESLWPMLARRGPHVHGYFGVERKLLRPDDLVLKRIESVRIHGLSRMGDQIKPAKENLKLVMILQLHLQG